MANGIITVAASDRKLSFSVARLQRALLNEIANTPMAGEAAASRAGAFGDMSHGLCTRDGDAIDDLRLGHCEAATQHRVGVQWCGGVSHNKSIESRGGFQVFAPETQSQLRLGRGMIGVNPCFKDFVLKITRLFVSPISGRGWRGILEWRARHLRPFPTGLMGLKSVVKPPRILF